MGTRRWFVELERWMWKQQMSREDVARRSGHDFGHVRELFDQDDPNPTLRFYLDLLAAAGARMDTTHGNSVEHVVTRLGELRRRADLSVAELARRAGMRRPHLSGIINGSRANMQLAVFDVLVTVLGAEEEMRLVDRWHLSQDRLLALAAGAETIAAGDGSSKPHLHLVSNSEAPRTAASRSAGAASAAAAPQRPPDDVEQRAAEKQARAEQARARADAKAEAERDRAVWAEQERAERAEYERAQTEERAREERAAQERAAQERDEQARAEAAARAVAAAAAARAALQNKVMVGAGIALAIVGGVCIAKGIAGLRSNAE
jgi:transcriptional regulator with XRE-family HTH domain